MTTTVVIADDHPAFRSGVRAVLDLVDGIDVVAEAADGIACLAVVTEHKPDVVLMDITMPRLDGISATRQILDLLPTTRVLVLTMTDDDESVFAAMRAGAHGYLLKESTHDQIRRAVEAVAEGDVIFGPGIAARVTSYLSQPRPATALFPELTSREREILGLVASGLSYQRISVKLSLSTKTVRNYASAVFKKLQVADRVEAAALAQGAGLGGAQSSA